MDENHSRQFSSWCRVWLAREEEEKDSLLVHHPGKQSGMEKVIGAWGGLFDQWRSGSGTPHRFCAIIYVAKHDESRHPCELFSRQIASGRPSSESDPEVSAPPFCWPSNR